MRTLWKGAISFGLVNIPVKLYTATENKDIKFNYLHEKCKSPITYKKYCPVCATEIAQEELVKGYEYEKGKYVVIKEEDFHQISPDLNKTVDIIDFVNLAEIDPVYYDKSYFLVPNDGGQKAYALLKRAMEETGRIGIAKVTIRTKQSLAAIRVQDKGLIMETMFYPDEIRSSDLLTELNYSSDIHDNEIKMAVSLIGNLSGAFEPEKYNDNYREALLKLIEGKITGEEVEVLPIRKEGKVVDLMEALRASIKITQDEVAKTTEQEEKSNRRRKTS